MEDWCAEGIFLKIQVKGINNFWGHFPTQISKNTLKTVIFDNLKTWRSAYSKNLGGHVFLSKVFILVGVFVFLTKASFINENCFSTLMTFSTSKETNHQFFSSKSWKLQCFFSMWVFFLKVQNYSWSIIFQFSKKNQIWRFFL